MHYQAAQFGRIADDAAELINQYWCFEETATVLMQRGAQLGDEAISGWELLQLYRRPKETPSFFSDRCGW